MFFWILLFFLVGYSAIIGEHKIRINKAASALFAAILCWISYLFFSNAQLRSDLYTLSHHVSGIAQILFFLIAAMSIVELIDSHRGFSVILDWIRTTSKRRLMWIIAFLTFFLSAALDNLTTTILMVSLVRKLIPDQKERLLPCGLIVIAANAGGAWTPIGDVTTTMLWIEGQISSIAIMKALFLPSLVSLFVPLLYFSQQMKGHFTTKPEQEKREPGAVLVFVMGVLGLVFIPIFKALTGLPPFMGALFSLSILWITTDLMHFKENKRSHLRMPHIFSKIDLSGVLFFLGILLAVAALDTSGILVQLAAILQKTFATETWIATFIGMLSAIVDNVPLVAATMGMYPLEHFPPDSNLWHLIAYTAGTGGSMLIIGSAAGVALMGIEKIDFISYLKKVSLPAFLGYLAGIATYLLTA